MPPASNTRKSTRVNRQASPPASGDLSSLAEEIAIMRDAILRLNSLFSEKQGNSDDVLKLTEALGRTASRLATLAHTQHQLSGSEENELQQVLSQALKDAAEALGID